VQLWQPCMCAAASLCDWGYVILMNDTPAGRTRHGHHTVPVRWDRWGYLTGQLTHLVFLHEHSSWFALFWYSEPRSCATSEVL